MNNLVICIFIFFILANCSNQTKYSGKILNKEELQDINFVDPIENKFFYFSEKSEKKSIFKKKINFSYVFVFKIDENDQIIESQVFNTKEIENINFTKDKTSNQIVRRGLLEKIFGGVGTQQELPTTP